MPDGRKIDILKLHSLLADREVVTIPLENIKAPSNSKKSGFSKLRLQKSDTSFALIVDEAGFLIDGRHRFFKLLESGEKVANVKVASVQDIAAAEVQSDDQLMTASKF